MKKLIALMCFTALLCGCSNSKSSSEESSSEAKDIAPVTEAAPAVSDDEYEKNAADESWREVYKENILSLKESPEYKENIYFSVYDINNDGCPELIVNTKNDNDMKSQIFRCEDGKLVNAAEYDTSLWCVNENGVLLRFGYDEAADENYTDYISSGNNYNTILSARNAFKLVDNKEEYTYFIDGEEVDEDEYNSKTGSLGEGFTKELGFDFALNDKEINAVFDKNGGYEKAYAAYLSSVQDKGFEEGIAFSLLDINDDDVPELFISDGVSPFSSVILLTYDDGLRAIGKFGSYGRISFDKNTKVLHTSNKSMGYTSGACITLTKRNKLQLDLNYMENSGAAESDGSEDEVFYKMNGVNISKDDYYDTIDKYTTNEQYSLGRDNDLSDASVKALEEGKYKAPELFDPETVTEPAQSYDYSQLQE